MQLMELTPKARFASEKTFGGWARPFSSFEVEEFFVGKEDQRYSAEGGCLMTKDGKTAIDICGELVTLVEL